MFIIYGLGDRRFLRGHIYFYPAPGGDQDFFACDQGGAKKIPPCQAVRGDRDILTLHVTKRLKNISLHVLAHDVFWVKSCELGTTSYFQVQESLEGEYVKFSRSQWRDFNFPSLPVKISGPPPPAMNYGRSHT